MIGTRSAFYLGMTPIYPTPYKSQNDSIERNQPILFHDQNKQESNKISQSLFDSPNRLKQLEQLSWNVDRTGEIGKWDITRATNFQVDSEKHPYLNAALRGVNNTTGFVACIENMATNSVGTILFDLPAAIEDLSVEHGGPSFQELAFSMQGATPGVRDEAVPYVLGRLSSVSRGVRVLEKIFDDSKLKIVTDPVEREVLIDKLVFSAEQIQKKFKHAADFGLDKSYGKKSAIEFEKLLKDHLKSSETKIIYGEYRRMPAIHFVNLESKRNVIFSMQGKFWSCWELTTEKLTNLVKHGSI